MTRTPGRMLATLAAATALGVAASAGTAHAGQAAPAPAAP
jgi:hypothetical protein